MFCYSEHELPGCVAHILGATARCVAYYQIYNIFGLAVEELLWMWWVNWVSMFKVCAFSEASGFQYGANGACFATSFNWVSEVL